MRAPLLALAVVASGCTCPPPSTEDSGTSADGGPLAVTGDFIDRALLADGGVLEQPQPLHTRTLTALVERPDGTFDSYPGQGQPDGTFTVPNVPEGRYTLQLGNLLVHTDTRVVHLGTNSLGRPDAYQANPGEGLSLTADNLAPWTADDELELASWGPGLGSYSTARQAPPFAANAPDAGDTALAAAGLDMEGARVVEAARGDVLTILQLSGERRDGGVLVKTATRAMDVATTVAIGMLTPVDGGFTTLPLTSATLSMRVGEFVKHQSAVGLGATPYLGRLYLDAHPGPFGRSTSPSGTPDLALVEWPPDAGDAVSAVQYGNPFPAPWTTYLGGGALFDVLYQASFPDGGLAFPRAEQGYVSVALEASAVGTPVTPLVSPVRNVTLDRLLANSPLSVGTTPVLAWDAPAMGTVARVEIEAVELGTTGVGVSTRQLRGILRVIGPWQSLRLPPGFLNPGREYFLRLTCLSLPPGYDREWPLLDVGPPAGAAASLTAAFKTH